MRKQKQGHAQRTMTRRQKKTDSKRQRVTQGRTQDTSIKFVLSLNERSKESREEIFSRRGNFLARFPKIHTSNQQYKKLSQFVFFSSILKLKQFIYRTGISHFLDTPVHRPDICVLHTTYIC